MKIRSITDSSSRLFFFQQVVRLNIGFSSDWLSSQRWQVSVLMLVSSQNCESENLSSVKRRRRKSWSIQLSKAPARGPLVLLSKWCFPVMTDFYPPACSCANCVGCPKNSKARVPKRDKEGGSVARSRRKIGCYGFFRLKWLSVGLGEMGSGSSRHEQTEVGKLCVE